MSELKPCPFCGESEDIDFGIYTGTLKGFDYVQCQNCGAEIKSINTYYLFITFFNFVF